MEPRYLRQLAEIIDLGSLSLAAQALNTTQPTLSRNIKSLEASIGAPVLRRGRYGVTPTVIGAALARDGRAIRDALQQADRDLGHWRAGLGGRLRIGVGTMLAHSLLPQFLAQQRSSRWNVALRIDVQGPERLLDRVSARDLDAAIVQIEPYFPKGGLTQIPLLRGKLAYYAGVNHPLAHKKLVTDKDIARALDVGVGGFSVRRARSTQEPRSKTSEGPQIEVSGDMSIALHLLNTGIYIAALPQFVMSHLCDERRFVRLAYHGDMPNRTLSVWHREDIGGHPLVKDFCRRFVGFVAMLQAQDNAAGPLRSARG